MTWGNFPDLSGLHSPRGYIWYNLALPGEEATMECLQEQLLRTCWAGYLLGVPVIVGRASGAHQETTLSEGDTGVRFPIPRVLDKKCRQGGGTSPWAALWRVGYPDGWRGACFRAWMTWIQQDVGSLAVCATCRVAWPCGCERSSHFQAFTRPWYHEHFTWVAPFSPKCWRCATSPCKSRSGPTRLPSRGSQRPTAS